MKYINFYCSTTVNVKHIDYYSSSDTSLVKSAPG